MATSSPTVARLGCARASALEQDPALQHDALQAIGVQQASTARASGALSEGPQPTSVLEQLRPRDALDAHLGRLA